MKQKRTRGKEIQILVLVIVVIVTFGSGIVFAASDSDEEAVEGKELALDEIRVKPDNICATGYDVVFCIDNSGSIWEQQEIRDEALRSIANLAVGSDIRIGGIYFGNKIYKKQGLTSMENTEGSKKIIKEFLNMTEKDMDNRDTDIGMALEEAQTLFENQDSYRERLIILFSDGINEDSDEDPTDKEVMDDETIKQAQLLDEKNIPIYCVYLQKEVNDEEFLKKLVNYFDSRNSYDERQFKKVTESEIDTLSEQFAEIFYSMQKDMKFKKIYMDSSGELSFYVPEMGVKKIQIYLKNDSWYNVKLNPLDGKGDVENWKDGNNTYIEVQNPKTGYWMLEISGDDKEDTRGTIAYYADVSASAEFISKRENDGEAHKNDKQRLKVHFFDEYAGEIPANSVADVFSTIIITSEDGKLTKKELQLKPTDNGYESEEFVWEEYGTYDLDIRLLYEDFLDLTYNFEERRVEASVWDIVPLLRIIWIIVLVLFILLLLFKFVSILCEKVVEWHRNQINKERVKYKSEYDIKYGSISSICNTFQQKIKESDQIEREYKNVFNTLNDLCQKRLPEELQKDYKEFLKKEPIEGELQKIRKIEKDTREKKEALDHSKEQAEGSVKEASKKKLKYGLDLLHTYMKEIDDAVSYFSQIMDEYTHGLESIRAETEKMARISRELEEMLDKPVKCTLRLSYKEHIGSKKCKNLKGGYSLDEIRMLSKKSAIQTLGDILDRGSTGIYVYGYEDDHGNAGLKLKSAKAFVIKNGSSGRTRTTREADLLGGETYIVIPDNVDSITIEVKKEYENVK